MKYKSYFITLLIIGIAALSACGPSYEEAQRMSKAERLKRLREDSLALKIGVTPTLDCLPVFLAQAEGLFDTAQADIRLKRFQAQIDVAEALRKGKIEGCVTDLVRTQRLVKQGVDIHYFASTNAYWQLVSNRLSRVKDIKQLNDKMVAMTRYSAPALLADYAIDSVKLNREHVFLIQINDVDLRLRMLLNNEMDAMLLTEPQATAARLYKHKVLMDSRQKGLQLGVIAFSTKGTKDQRRKQQIEVFAKGYKAACDSLNKHGIKHYAQLLKDIYKLDNKTLNALPDMTFGYGSTPKQSDVNVADKWLNKQ